MKLQVAVMNHRTFLRQCADRLIGLSQGRGKLLQIDSLNSPLMGQGSQLVQVLPQARSSERIGLSSSIT